MRFLFFILLIYCCTAQAQNLVPNPSFEDATNCPFDVGLISYCNGWYSFRESPDYFNPCTNSPDIDVPKNDMGYQFSASGSSYAGVATYSTPNFREFIGVQLSKSLIPGVKYYLSMKVSLSDRSFFGSDGLGISFTTKKYDNSLNNAPINNNDAFHTSIVLAIQ